MTSVLISNKSDAKVVQGSARHLTAPGGEKGGQHHALSLALLRGQTLNRRTTRALLHGCSGAFD
jgi:hypothetical protein